MDRLAWTEPDADESAIEGLVASLGVLDGLEADLTAWPARLWSALEDAGATRWSLAREFGGLECPRPLLVERYARLATGSLTAVFILSQHDAAVRRLAAAEANPIARRSLELVGSGQAFPTVGISHLTTSRRLGLRPVVAIETDRGYRLDGTIPWVTAAARADFLVTAAALDDGRHFLVGLPSDRAGVTVRPPFDLAALQASGTTEVLLEGVMVEAEELLAGPAHDLAAQPGAVGTAGLETSALALGQARSALIALDSLAADRADLLPPLDALVDQWRIAWDQLIAQARGEAGLVSASDIRATANNLVLRSTQAYLTARKGSGFLRSDPAQRWARQALFFLVWSCPTPVAQAALREMAGIRA